MVTRERFIELIDGAKPLNEEEQNKIDSYRQSTIDFINANQKYEAKKQLMHKDKAIIDAKYIPKEYLEGGIYATKEFQEFKDNAIEQAYDYYEAKCQKLCKENRIALVYYVNVNKFRMASMAKRLIRKNPKYKNWKPIESYYNNAYYKEIEELKKKHDVYITVDIDMVF